MFRLFVQKTIGAASYIAGVVFNIAALTLLAFVWLFSQQVTFPIFSVAAGIAFVVWIWWLAGAGAAVLAALVVILAAALIWLAQNFLP